MKQTFVLLFIVVASHSCTPGNTDGQRNSTLAVKLDSVSQSLVAVDSQYKVFIRKISFLDSNLKYGRLAAQMEINMSRAEADYYRTGNEKYYNLYYKYRKKQWEYAGLNRKYYDSLHAK